MILLVMRDEAGEARRGGHGLMSATTRETDIPTETI